MVDEKLGGSRLLSWSLQTNARDNISPHRAVHLRKAAIRVPRRGLVCLCACISRLAWPVHSGIPASYGADPVRCHEPQARQARRKEVLATLGADETRDPTAEEWRPSFPFVAGDHHSSRAIVAADDGVSVVSLAEFIPVVDPLALDELELAFDV